jgi:hypothetical protein
MPALELPPLLELAIHDVVAVIAFLIIVAAALLLHRSAHFIEDWLPRPFIWIIHGVAWLLFLLDVLGFIIVVVQPFGGPTLEEFREVIRHLIRPQ